MNKSIERLLFELPEVDDYTIESNYESVLIASIDYERLRSNLSFIQNLIKEVIKKENTYNANEIYLLEQFQEVLGRILQNKEDFKQTF